MADNKHDNDDVIVAFNGKDHRLKEWARKEKAATDDDPSLNWRKVFETHMPKPSHDLGESASTGFVPHKKLKKKGRNSSGSSLGPLIKQFWVPLLSAVIVGLGIGFTVLIVFSHHEKAAKQNVPAIPTTTQPQATETKTSSINGSDFSISLQVIQGNQYSSESAAKDGIVQFKNKNIPAAIFNENGKYDVMIGVAVDESVRRQLAAQFGDLELYGKAWSYKPKSIKTSEQISQFLKSGRELLLSMIPLSANKAIDQSVDDKKLTEINQGIGKWTGIDQLNVKGSLKEDLTSFRGAVESAYSHIKNQDDPDNAQQSILDAVSTYQKILLALSE